MYQFNSAFTLFLSLIVEAMPFLLLGVLFSGLLQFFVSERRLVALLPKNAFLGSLAGSCIGFLFPVCECGNIPVARRLLMQGAPASVAIGFLLAAPVINPIVIWATWVAFRDQPEVVFLRVGLSLAIATLLGWIFSIQKDLRPFLRPAVATAITVRQDRLAQEPQATPSWKILETNKPKTSSPLLGSGMFLLGQSNQPLPTGDAIALQAAFTDVVKQPLSLRLRLLVEGMVQELRELAGVLIFGSLVAALLQTFVPREWVLSLGQDPVTSVLAMMLLAALVSICSTVDSFFALSFSSSFTTGSLVSFLVFGPMIDLKGVGLMLTMFKPRAIVYLFAIAAQLTFISGMVLNFYFG
ncbi:permease [Alkalinema sp. FACHB-956]|uniref:permease n=1 Tax=Alkalinema sp. FACHB-956 TaxID=2692768 RepID=UPI001687FC7F|nr:permease [Alkalinema sp. FACHB-956]MBD2328545.1 permease [Alkalinema sp. FACHB-956]